MEFERAFANAGGLQLAGPDPTGIEIVFKDGVRYDPEKLVASVRGVVGLR